MELHGARVFIRPWERFDDDQADTWPPYNDPLDPLWNLPRVLSFSSDMWSTIFENGMQRRSWAVENRSGILIGRISLREIDKNCTQARLGVTFGAPYVGRGLGSEALILFLDYYFESLNFHTLVLDVAAPNVRAVRCYTRLGFSYVDSDWRDTGSLFDQQILDRSIYASLRRHFRHDARGLKVEFYEMRLYREEWIRHRASVYHHG